MGAGSGSDWAGARGDRWRDHVDGLETMLRPVDSLLIDGLALAESPGMRIADLGCGGGGSTRAIARSCAPGATVRGYDLSESLVSCARVRSGGASGVSFECADLETAPRVGAPYDRLASRFGVMFFAGEERAFANLRSWLAPRDGRFAFLVWGDMSENPWSSDAGDIVGELVELPEREPGSPGPGRYADVESFAALLQRAGFADVSSTTWRGTLPVGGASDAEAASRFALSAFGTISRALDDAGPECRREAEAALAARWGRFEAEGEVRVPALAHLVIGRSGEPREPR